jgi:hypothetical protein
MAFASLLLAPLIGAQCVNNERHRRLLLDCRRSLQETEKLQSKFMKRFPSNARIVRCMKNVIQRAESWHLILIDRPQLSKNARSATC